MGLKDAFDKAVDAVSDTMEKAKDALEKTIEQGKDAASEAGHRASAQAEQASRDAAGDDLTLGEKVASVANQVKHETAAEIDSAKQKIRDAS
jgi:hypothetical protein